MTAAQWQVCLDQHSPVGFMTNQSGFDRDRPHASMYTCQRDECRQSAARWVKAKTGEVAYFTEFDGGAS